MKTITQEVVGNRTSANYFRKPIENQTMIDEERHIYGLLLSSQNRNEIRDREVLRTIKRMSVMEIIN